MAFELRVNGKFQGAPQRPPGILWELSMFSILLDSLAARPTGGRSVRPALNLVLMMASCALLTNAVTAQTAESLAAVKRVAIEWPGGDRGSAATRERVLRKLKASKTLQVVANAAQADGVLHGEVRVWLSGHISTTPRSGAVQQALYRGYATAELTGKDGRTLWSYLAAPRSPGWKSIGDDLGDQLVQALLSALAKKEADATAGETSGGNPGAKQINLHGAGSTFSAPIYQRWFEGFSRERPDISVEYAAVGSEEGIRRVTAGAVDFGTSDMPLTEERLRGPERKLTQIATVLGAVVPIYNFRAGPDGLNLTGEVLAAIFLGKIKKWNAPEIRAINRHAHLPDEAIAVIHRSDGAGTTFVWTEYLSKMSAEWKSSVGAGSTVKWPVGVGAERNDGVAEAVGRTPYAIGYVELLYALQHELEYAAVRNGSGEFVKADLDSVTAAAKTAVVPEDTGFGVSITNAAGKHVYPIATFTWMLLPDGAEDAAKKAALRDLLRWMLTEGQKQCEGLGYAPLPGGLANRELAAVERNGN